ncbi:hypothetical protein FPQ18DRAFT_338539 [Pyronema domesticum]|nr:hypothetical protein FPQ18DRAFT_338539 [Pyronema domesticum]
MADSNNPIADSSSSNQDLSNPSEPTPPAGFDIIQKYPPRGSLTQYRLSSATAFTCSRCTKQKKAKLIAVRDGNWKLMLCNGCYGNILSRE